MSEQEALSMFQGLTYEEKLLVVEMLEALQEGRAAV